MTEMITGFLPSVLASIGYVALQRLGLQLKESKGAGSDNPILNAAMGIVGNVAGARVDATFVSWFRKNGQKWIDRSGDADPNHVLPQAVFLSSRMACYCVGKRFAKKNGLDTRDWAGPFSGSISTWLSEAVDFRPVPLSEAAAKPWLDSYLSVVAKEYESMHKHGLQSEEAARLMEDGTDELLERLDVLIRTAEGKSTDQVIGMAAAGATFSSLIGRHSWGTPPEGFEEAFRKEWFGVLCLDFAARLRNDQPVFQMFVSSQLAALQIERPELPDSAGSELRDLLTSWLERLEGKIDSLTQVTVRGFEDIAKRFDRFESGLAAGYRQSSHPEPAPEPPNLPPWGGLPAVVKSLPRKHRMLFSSLGDRFVARTSDLWRVHDAIGSARLAVVSGTGGVGKTQLAVEYVWRFGRCYPGGVFWVEAESGRSKMVADIARGADITIEGSLSEKDQLEVLWRKLAVAPALVVLNNLPEEAFVRDWLPAEALISVLITTRRRATNAESEVPLAFFNPQESLALLNSGNRRHRFADAEPLIDGLGGLPLALELARGNLDSLPSLSIERFMEQLGEAGYTQMWSRIAWGYKDSLPSGHGKSILATFQLSWNAIENEDARDILQAIAEIAPEPVPFGVLQRVRGFRGPEGAEDLKAAVDELARISLIDRVGEDSVRAHRLVLGFVRESDPGAWELTEQVAEAVAEEMDRIWDDHAIVDNARALVAIVPHAESLFHSDRCLGETKLRLSLAVAWYQRWWGRYRDQLEWAERALKLAEQIHRRDPDRIANVRSYLGNALQVAGDLHQAARVCQEVLNYREASALDAHDVRLAVAQCDLGEVELDLGHFREARALFEKSVASLELLPHDQSWADSSMLLGRCLTGLDELEEGKRCLIKAMEWAEAYFGQDHIYSGTYGNSLAPCLRELGQSEGALKLYEKSLAVSQATYGPDHPQIAVSQGNLSDCLYDLGIYDEAIRTLEQALASFESNLPPEHQWIAAAASKLAVMQIEAGLREDATKRLEQSIASVRAGNQPDNGWLPGTLYRQGRVLVRFGRYEEARDTLSKALVIQESRLPPGHTQIAASRARLGLAFIKLGEIDRGQIMLRESRAMLLAKLAPRHGERGRLQRDIDAASGD